MTDQSNPEIIEQETRKQRGLLGEVVQAVSNLILPTNRDLITLLRTPTPVKFSKSYLVDAGGTIGGGLASPTWQELYRCPVSQEAWLHRISITCPEHGPSNALQTGEIFCAGSTGETIFWLPILGNVAPVQIVEGRLSAPHLNSGEVAQLVGDSLPAGIHIRIDLQIILTTGVSQDTPRRQSPSDLEQAETPVLS